MSMEDIGYIGVSLLSLAIVVVLFGYIFAQFYSIPIFQFDLFKQMIDGWKTWDTFFIFAVLILCLGTIILAYFVPTHPAFFIAGILNLLLIMMVAPMFSNIYAAIMEGTPLLVIANDYPKMNYIIGIMPIISLAISILLIAVQYGKPQSGGMRGL